MTGLRVLASTVAALALSSLTLTAYAAVTATVDSMSGNCTAVGPQGFNAPLLGFGKLMTGLGPCDVTITVSGMAQGGSTDITLFEGVENMTGFRWHDFHHTLGYGSGAGFRESGETDDVFFFNTPAPTGDQFVLSGQDDPTAPDSLDWLASGPDFPSGGPTPNIFTLGLHIHDVDAQGVADNDGSTTFVLRQRATILPEPGALSLWLLVSAAALMARRRRR